jgi:hypothetical protein
VSVNELIDATYMPWAKQMVRVFDGRSGRDSHCLG